MAIQYAVIDGAGSRLMTWDWAFDDGDTWGAEITPSYCVWMIPGTAEVE